MTFEEFNGDIMKSVKGRPEFIRFGQAVFNYVEQKYGVARTAQFKYGVDCFYDDTKVGEFILTCYNILNDEKVQA